MLSTGASTPNNTKTYKSFAYYATIALVKNFHIEYIDGRQKKNDPY